MQKIIDDFDDYAKDYRSIHNENIKLSGADSFYFAEMKVKLLQATEPNEKLNVLDIGCGDGTTELFMHQYFPQWQLTGIDVSEKSISEATLKNIPTATFAQYNGKKVAAKDATFDIIFIAGVLHHVEFVLHEQLLLEVFRLLKPCGRLYLFEHNPFNPVTKHLVNTCVFDKDARLLKAGYTVSLLKKVGFKKIRKNYIIFFPRKGWLSKLIFLEKYLSWLPLGGQYFLKVNK